jgi:hypothetical protein
MPEGKPKSASKKFVFRKHANIGAADAIVDKNFLSNLLLIMVLWIFLQTCRTPCAYCSDAQVLVRRPY